VDLAALRAYLVEKLKEPGTYGTAFVVGTLINLYGHALVPWLRGRPQTLAGFVDELRHEPGLMTTSILLGYVFPFLVGTYSAVVTRYRARRTESRAQFPDLKPDPVFRASPDGRILEAGAGTEALFRRHGVARAQDVIGEGAWERLVLAARAGGPPPDGRVFFEPESAWYLVGYAPSREGAVNVYLTRVSEPTAVAS
jgi:hypothetical protein